MKDNLRHRSLKVRIQNPPTGYVGFINWSTFEGWCSAAPVTRATALRITAEDIPQGTLNAKALQLAVAIAVLSYMRPT